MRENKEDVPETYPLMKSKRPGKAVEKKRPLAERVAGRAGARRGLIKGLRGAKSKKNNTFLIQADLWESRPF